ncbi:MAG TPA: ferrous iron transporter B, partial [Firmicutes bacterium]|nr:ferrous iron transporter B [Bacillota bacterium]
VLQVVDMKNLRRALVLTSQLTDLERTGGIALNMADEARERGISVNVSEIEKIVGVKVEPTVAIRKSGVREIAESSITGRPFTFRIRYSSEIESAIEQLEKLLPSDMRGKRGIALMILAGDETVANWLQERVPTNVIEQCEAVAQNARAKYSVSLNSVISMRRLTEIDRFLTTIMSRRKTVESKVYRNLSQWSTHPVKGLLLLAIVLYVTLWFVGLFGAGTAVDFFETVIFGRYVNPASIWVVDHVLPFPHEHLAEESEYTFALPLSLFHEWEFGTSTTMATSTDYRLTAETLTWWQSLFRLIHDFLVGEYGAITMALSYGFAIVLPIVFTFFILFSVLEDSGYLPRLAVMTNRVFRIMGLNGKAVLPMILGLGCVTMATMTTRILETKKERMITTLLLALGVPCSAQLGVILAMVASISIVGVIWWGATVTIVILAVGWLAAKLFKGETSDLVLELPPLRTPQISNILVKTLARIEWYLKEVVPLFILGTAILFILDRTNSLGVIQSFAAPVVQNWLGLPARATEAFLLGFLRRDYGAAGLLVLQQQGFLDEIQVIVSLVTITLFVPCIATVFMIAKEQGVKRAIWMVVFIFPFAFLIGGIIRWLVILSHTVA